MKLYKAEIYILDTENHGIDSFRNEISLINDNGYWFQFGKIENVNVNLLENYYPGNENYAMIFNNLKSLIYGK